MDGHMTRSEKLVEFLIGQEDIVVARWQTVARFHLDNSSRISSSKIWDAIMSA